jgi:hypothetical protein
LIEQVGDPPEANSLGAQASDLRNDQLLAGIGFKLPPKVLRVRRRGKQQRASDPIVFRVLTDAVRTATNRSALR